jgi:8-oxo-dGTP pyrophosphatase MutT (NUDIX family)
VTARAPALFERARAALRERPGARFDPAELRRAAVAVVLLDRGGAAQVPVIVRGHDAPVHGGQIALPGGRMDPSDADLIATARREAHEELGLVFGDEHVLGTLDDVATPSGFLITPVVAALAGAPHIVPDPVEVADWFEVPLALFADPSAAEVIGERTWRGRSYTLRGYAFGPHRIWGATARILEDLAARMA